ncbi:2-hydroxyacyl-CoA dehydratase subunit D [Thermodesulfobacteriota bacterium]
MSEKDFESFGAVEELYRDRSERARELRDQGRKIVGYFSSLIPTEMLTALGLVPYRITGNATEPPVESTAFLETNACSFVHSCLDLALRGQYDFLDGIIVPHFCDHFTKAYTIFKHHLNLPYSYFLNIPHLSDASSRKFFRRELETFKGSLENFTHQELSLQRLIEAIEAHNRNRTLVRDLYELRKEDPPLISGSETTKVLTASMRVPIGESNALIEHVIRDAKERSVPAGNDSKRLLVYGSVIDQTPFMDLIEGSGANIVMDVLYGSSINYFSDVRITEDPLDGLVQHYLELPSGRTYNKPRTGTHRENVDNRFHYIYDYAEVFKAHAVILYAIRHCEVFGFDLPDLRDYLKEKGLPVLVIEEEYTMTSTERLRMRIEAFLETLSE